jgi:hypothetical protein
MYLLLAFPSSLVVLSSVPQVLVSPQRLLFPSSYYYLGLLASLPSNQDL